MKKPDRKPAPCVCGHDPRVDPEGLVDANGEIFGAAIFCINPDCTTILHAGGATVAIALQAWRAVVSCVYLKGVEA
jgi:hypothetical protein